VKFRTTAILLLVFVALIGYVYLVELNKKPAETPVDKSTWVLTLGRDDVQELRVADGDKSIVLARSGDAWYLGAVGGEEADATRVGNIVVSLVNLRSSRVLTGTMEGLAAYGLENPTMTVTLVLQAGTQEVLLIGGKNPQGSSYYVQRKGYDPIHLIYTSLVDDLRKLVSEPPYKPTPTPEPTPTPGSASEGTPAPATLAPAVTPTP